MTLVHLYWFRDYHGTRSRIFVTVKIWFVSHGRWAARPVASPALRRAWGLGWVSQKREIGGRGRGNRRCVHFPFPGKRWRRSNNGPAVAARPSSRGRALPAVEQRRGESTQCDSAWRSSWWFLFDPAWLHDGESRWRGAPATLLCRARV